MKKILIVLSFVILSIFSYAEEVLFVTGEWSPYTSEKMSNQGDSTELIKAICKEAGITPVFKFFPWARGEAMVESGEAFASFPYVATQDRKAKFYLSDVFQYGENVYMYYEANENITSNIKNAKSLNDIKALTFGSMLGSFTKKEFDDRKIKYFEVGNMEQMLSMLKAKRIDMVIDEKAALYHQIKKSYPGEINKFKILSVSYGEKMSNVLIVSKKYKNSQGILKKFNEGLKKLKASGEYDKLIKKNNMSGI